ncbi:MAG TPA: DUF1638 domain-containing protein [Phycisphaerae bacterium]|nr:DUF1638 domain-containing protein [Phycisphaerae bacterium]HOM51152.1 DUF1638 domain-containing protein [Phycisphaerae bacterium]HON68796.1 DUF1638 domain-containing protein [Phycisphaerae bacterium]HOQ84501.1 DUF1638 domain-containing protein [Phycisphaerae bacterium]HPP25280.1 DUF1638 domain-containing protein [Phycisphaerae bacterium]
MREASRRKLISCEIFYREMCAVVARSPWPVDIEFLPKGLHDIGAAGMRARVQEAVDRVDTTRYEAILLGYGLCNNGIAGLTAPAIPIVVPRAHDCITLFFGSRLRYLGYFNSRPGTYFKTTGWIERGTDAGELRQLSVSHQLGMDQTYEELVAKYGEDNAQYLWDTLCNTLRNYKQLTFIEMGIEPDDRFERQTRDEAARRGWTFEKVRGDMTLIERLINGPWDEADFLVVPPGRRIVSRTNDAIIDLQ